MLQNIIKISKVTLFTSACKQAELSKEPVSVIVIQVFQLIAPYSQLEFRFYDTITYTTLHTH